MWQMSIGGAERAVYLLVREQRRRALDADVVVASGHGVYAERAREAGARVYDLGCRGVLDVRHTHQLVRLAGEYDIVHHHAIEPLLMTASSRARTPRLVYTHRGGVRNHGWQKRLRLRVARAGLRRFDGLSANTRLSARVLAGYLGISESRIRVVYNGLDFDLLQPVRSREDVVTELPSCARDAFVVGTAAKLQPLKRVQLLLGALQSLRDHRIHGVILGDGPERAHLEDLAAALGLGDRVSFLGRKNCVGDYLQLMDAFVLPSGPEEAFGNAAVEAMGLGIPTVVFADGGGLVEHVVDRKTGLVVSDQDDLARALGELAADPVLRMHVGGSGRRYVRETYSLDAMFERYNAIYRAAMAIGC